VWCLRRDPLAATDQWRRGPRWPAEMVPSPAATNTSEAYLYSNSVGVNGAEKERRRLRPTKVIAVRMAGQSRSQERHGTLVTFERAIPQVATIYCAFGKCQAPRDCPPGTWCGRHNQADMAATARDDFSTAEAALERRDQWRMLRDWLRDWRSLGSRSCTSSGVARDAQRRGVHSVRAPSCPGTCPSV